jgi:uncharacterized protein YjaG (DUF416 family)
MKMKYDEALLKNRLDELSGKLRTVFAALCAERLAPAYAPFASRNARDPGEINLLLEQLWKDLGGAEISGDDLRARRDLAEELIPDDDETWVGLSFYASDAAAALAYAYSARLSGLSQDAAWAARRAYEAVDYYATRKSAPHSGVGHNTEEPRIDGIVLDEITRQKRDLEDLRELADRPLALQDISALRQRAKVEAYHFLIG